MRVCWRLLIIWLTALALPVQGVAAVAMAHCGPSHGRMQWQAAQGKPTQGHTRHQPGPPCAHDMGLSAPAPSHVHHTHSAENAPAGDLAQFTCGACASCCTGLALLRTMPPVPEPLPVAPVFAVWVPAIAEVARPGPDRPPRLNLA
jgi:hypothetical protein